jgi:hypothetical protein
MRKIALIAMVMITLTTLGCSKKSEEPATESQMSPAPAAQENASGMEKQATPMNDDMSNGSMNNSEEKSAPMSEDSMGQPEESNDSGNMDDHSKD